MPRIITNENPQDAWPSLAPIFALSLQGEPRVIGTGFWISNGGLLVTAKHVITDNIGRNGRDIGSIAAFQFHKELGPISRPFKHSSMHALYDLALCTTTQFRTEDGAQVITDTLCMTLNQPTPGTPISTHSFHDIDTNTAGEKYPVIHRAMFEFKGSFSLDPAKEVGFKWASRVTVGHLEAFFPEGRDRVVLPFACYQSDVPVHNGMSGGPVFDDRGRVFAVNCTSFKGSDVSFHCPISGVLDLRVPNAGFEGDKEGRDWTVRELAAHHVVAFDPPV